MSRPLCTACRQHEQAKGLHGFCRPCWRELPETMRQRYREGRYKHSRGRFVRPEKH